MSFDMFGVVSVCSFTKATPIGWVGRQPLTEMWRGQVAQQLRSSVIADQLEPACSRCAGEIDAGNYHGVLASGFDRFRANRTTPWPARMEFALTNTCNLRCVMCSGDYSSAIRAKVEGLPPVPMRYGPEFVDELSEFLPTLEQARFLGGEPFLGEINFRIWDQMIETGSAVECNVTTNGTVWTPRVATVLDRLPFSIGVSIDGIRPGTVKAIRRGADHGQVLTNLNRFRSYARAAGTSVSLTYCLMPANWDEFAEFLLWADDLGCRVFVNAVDQPPSHALGHLPTWHLQRIVDTLERDRDQTAARLELNRQVWTEQIDRIGHLLALRLEGDDRHQPTPPALQEIVRELCMPGHPEEELVDLLKAIAVNGEVSVLRFDREEHLTSGSSYLGVDLTDAVGQPQRMVLDRVRADVGQQMTVLAEQVAPGVVVRASSLRRPQGPTQGMVVVLRRGPEPWSLSRYACFIDVPSASAPLPLPVRRRTTVPSRPETREDR